MPRQHNRIAIPLEVVLESSSGKRGARINDLSLGGCFVDSIASVQEGEKLSFKICLSPEEWEHMSGEVTYVMPGIGFGLRFNDPSENQQKRLTEIILANGGTP